MRIIVTGATGFIGRALCRELGLNHILLKFSRSHGYDISYRGTVFKVFEEFEPDAVVHLAVLSNHFASYSKHLRITVNGTKNVVDACNELSCRLVYMASCASTARGFTNYSRAKRAADEYVVKNSSNFVAIRPSVVYDVENLERLAKMYRVVPKGVMIQPVYRGYLVEILKRALKRGNGLYEVGDKKPIKVEEFARAIRGNSIVVPKEIFLAVKPILYFADIFTSALDIPLRGLVDYLLSDRICNIERATKVFKVRPVDTLEKINELKSSKLLQRTPHKA